ncbi:retention module-containing protein [Amphritea sp. HPY]|uniref:retention module-containing protein n=1 Tax=Amphritea sp. HPY TaxID=3421652 RepID=UPI003D7EB19D
MATHNLIATVSSVIGEVFVRDSEGLLHQLKAGDRLYEGDVVIPSNGGSVKLMMADGSPMTLDQPVEVTLSQEMLADGQPAAQDDAITDESVAAVLEALESGGDPTAVLPPPAAGAAADEGHDFIRLTRIVEEITPNAFPGDALAAADDDLLSPDLLDQSENEAPAINVIANDFVEDDEGTFEGAVAGTYSTHDEDGDNLTVTFTEGTNSEGYYALDTENNQVILTKDGFEHVNNGGLLPPIDLTVTDDGDPNLTGQDDDTPEVTTVNDAPNIDVTANDFVEDDPESTYEGAVAGTYTTADEDGDNLTVTFSEGTNSEGYYALDTDNNEVTLTQAGVDQVNSGGDLPPIDLTVTDDGDPNLTGQDDDTPEVTTVNDAPTIDVTANDFIEDDEGNVEGVVAGTYTTVDEDGDNLTVTFTEGTNSEGYYALDTDNDQVTLTEAGVVQVNSGGDLPPIDLTVTDDGDPNLTGQDDDTPEVTTVNDAPNIDVTANDFVEDDPESTYEGAVAGTYTTADEDGDNLTVTFSEGTNSEGYYALDTDNNEVTLTQAGVDQVNSGGDLPPIDLTVTDDGDPNLTGQDDDTPEVTTVNDAPTIDVTANDFVEDDASNVEGVVAGTYTTADEDGDNLTVTFTEGTNSEGYYALDTDNNEVTLTQAGVDQVNSGGDLSPIDLTVTDDGEPNLSGRDADTPEVDSLVHLDMTGSGGTVHDEGLLPDSENSATTSGSFTVTAPDGLASVTIAGYTLLVADLLNATEIAPLEVFSNADEELVITGYDAGSGSIDYSYTLMQPVAHELGSNQTTASFQVTATDQDGSVSEPADLVITQIDDIPEVMVSDGMGLNGVGQIIGALNGDPSADTPQTFNWGDVTSSVNIYANDEPVNISADESSRTVTGMLEDGTMVFTITLNEDLSTYTYQQYMPIQTEATDVLIAENLSGGNSDSFRLSLAGDEADPIQTEFFGYEFDDDLGEYARSTVNTSANNMGVGTGQDVDSDAGEMDQLFMSFDHNVTNMSIKVELTGGPTSTATFQYTVYSLQPSELESLGEDGFTYESLPDGGTTRTVTVSDEDTVEISAQDLGLDEFTFIVFEAVEGEYKLVPSELTVDYLTETQDFSLSAPFTLTDSDFDSAGDTIDIDIMGNQLSLIGDESDNALGGNEQDNSLTGGGGDDILTGGFGSDTFVWQLNDSGTAGDPAVDLITDFNDGLPGSDGDILDLSELLVGEDDNLTEFLHFSSDGTDSVLHISSSGGFTGGELDTNVVDQVIEFNGVDLVGDLTTQNDIIDNLMQSGNLITD